MDNNKPPEKKPRRVVANYNGTNYEDTGYMVCSICIKAFKIVEYYELHLEQHHKNLYLERIPIMKVFEELLDTEVNAVDPKLLYTVRKEWPIDQLMCATSKSVLKTSSTINVIENSSDSTAQMIVNLGLPETIGARKGINTFKITVDEFRRTITTVAENIRGQLVQRILQSPYFTLHFVEYLDMKNFATLIATVRYIHETHIKNELLFSKRLRGVADNESCVIITNFLRDYNLNWESCVGISLDNIRGNCELPNSFMEVIFNQGFMRHADFIAQQLPDVLAETLRDAIAILNILKRDISLKFDYEMDNEYQQTLYHTDQYWLSHGRLLSRLFEMRDKCKDMDELINFRDKLNDINWLYKLAYLADIFSKFKRFNRDLQVKPFKFRTYDKIVDMNLGLKMYETKVARRDFSNFPTLDRLLRTNEAQQDIDPDVLVAMTTNLQQLQVGMNRFSQPAREIEDYTWIRNPFDVNSDEIPPTLSMHEKKMLLKLKIDWFMKTKFYEEKLDYFWLCADDSYPDLATKAIKYLLIFTNSQLSELAFASLVNIRANSLTNLEHEESYLLIKLSNDDLTDT